MFIPTFVIVASISPIVFAVIFELLMSWSVKRFRRDPTDEEQRKFDNNLVTGVLIFIVLFVILAFIISTAARADGVSDIFSGAFVGMISLALGFFFPCIVFGKQTEKLSKTQSKILDICIVIAAGLFPLFICFMVNIFH